MQVRIRIDGAQAREREALERKARLFLGRYALSIEVLELSSVPRDRAGPAGGECLVVAWLRSGDALRVREDEGHLDRALLRIVWRLERRRDLAYLLDPRPSGVARERSS